MTRNASSLPARNSETSCSSERSLNRETPRPTRARANPTDAGRAEASTGSLRTITSLPVESSGAVHSPTRMDAASGIAVPAAFGAGVISFLSPCVLPLVPGYISAVAGGQPGEVRPRHVIGPSLLFAASFSAIFIALGLLGQQALHGA